MCFHSSYSSNFMFDLLAMSLLEVEIERDAILRYIVRFWEMVVAQTCIDILKSMNKVCLLWLYTIPKEEEEENREKKEV